VRPYEKIKTNPRCQVHGQWLDLTDQRCWRVLAPPIPYVYFCSLVIDPGTGDPFMLRPDAVPAVLRNNEIVFQLPQELISALDAAVQVELRRNEPSADDDEDNDDDYADDDADGDDDERRAPRPRTVAELQREARLEERRRNAEARDAARQATLRECLMGNSDE
jgi:hypothetical protein